MCYHNSARSQMAEGLLRSLCPQKYVVESAGLVPSIVSPYAVEAMREIGIDISQHTAKKLEEFITSDLDYVITVCDHVKETCPVFLRGKKYLHKSFKDPNKQNENEKKKIEYFRKVRDELQEWIGKAFGNK